jgi:glycosyltransferase involved in cell wall biosynthesis
MHYCYVQYGSWEFNASHWRPREMGKVLIERGVDVTYIVDDMPYNRTSLQFHAKANVVFVPRHRGQTAGRRRALADLKPDWLHLANPHPKSFLAAVGNTRLKIVGEWDEPPIWKPFGPVRHALEVVMDAWLRRRADRVVVCTRYLQEYFRDVHRIDAAYIPYATYLPQYPDGESPFKEQTVVYVGQFFPAWDHDLLFDAARLLAERGQRPPMVFLGNGPDTEKWRAWAAEKGLTNVSFPGFLKGPDLWRYMRHAHVLLFPMRDNVLNKARCSTKIFTYAQSRRPIIANRIGEIPEFLGDLPIYVDATPEAFAQAIRSAMSRDHLPDVEYHAERQNYDDRVDRLLEVLDGRGAGVRSRGGARSRSPAARAASLL